ncbi:hypothetical protein [uncultured Polaribacter sp.]|uniref:hypothetical protein n=1 Tax=uncultured Polaribacter sp. TaxID=174711 RepID=UPI00260BC000|nr:hypothetical protein [uncultured Polaribacter sp.]
MKNIKYLLSFIILISLNTYAQKVTQSNFTSKYPRSFKASHNIVIKNAILSDGAYVFEGKKGKIFITLENGIYTEIHPKNKFVKAKITWVSEYSYKLKIIETNKKKLKYNIGEEFISKITNINQDKYSYQRMLKNGRMLRGELLKLDEENSRK